MKRFFFICSLGLIASCTTPCSSVCDKLLSCEELSKGTVGDKECELDCAVQENSYEDDASLTEAFESYKECVMDKSCDEIAAGACHDSDLFAF